MKKILLIKCYPIVPTLDFIDLNHANRPDFYEKIRPLSSVTRLYAVVQLFWCTENNFIKHLVC